MSLPTKVQTQEIISKEFSQDQLSLIKNIICKGASEDEIAVFLQICRHTRLDPIAKQIYMIPRWDSKLNKNVYTPQTSIDGLRLIAERTGRYAPGPATKFEVENGKLISATSFVKKMTADGTWHTVEATAYFEEYVQTYTDKRSGETKIAGLWESKPRTMIAKVAESQALRRAFPNEMSGLYVDGELDKDVVDVMPREDNLSQEQLDELYAMSIQLPDLTQKMKEYYKINSFMQLTPKQYGVVKERLEAEIKKKITEFQAAREGE